MLLKRAALYIGSWIWDNINDDTKEKMKNKNFNLIEIQNRLKIILLYIAVTITLLSVSWSTGLWKEFLISFASFVLIRWWNGGHHFSVDTCYFVTVGVILGVVPLSYIIRDYQTLVLAITVILNIAYAPYNKESKHFYTKKIVSVVMCVLSVYINEIFLVMWFALGFDLIKAKRR